MKIKRALAALLAATMIMGMTSCGLIDKAKEIVGGEKSSASDKEDKDDDDEDEDEEEEEEEEKDEDKEEEKDEESKAETEPAETEPAETEPATEESEAPVVEEPVDTANGFSNEFYTIKVDPSKWSYNEVAGVDCGYMYTGVGDNVDYATANFNIISMSDSIYASLTPSDYVDSIKETYASMEGFEVKSTGSGTLNGYETCDIEVSYDIAGQSMTIKQVILSNEEALVAISYGALDSVLGELQPEFDEVLSTFAFK